MSLSAKTRRVKNPASLKNYDIEALCATAANAQTPTSKQEILAYRASRLERQEHRVALRAATLSNPNLSPRLINAILDRISFDNCLKSGTDENNRLPAPIIEALRNNPMIHLLRIVDPTLAFLSYNATYLIALSDVWPELTTLLWDRWKDEIPF